MSAAKSYAKPVEVGATMVGGTVGEVVASRDANFPVDIAMGYGGWQDYPVANGSGLRKLNPVAAPVSTALGVLGVPGVTACGPPEDRPTPGGGSDRWRERQSSRRVGRESVSPSDRLDHPLQIEVTLSRIAESFSRGEIRAQRGRQGRRC
jgi:N-terminal domain of oxidoreductase